MSDIIDKESIKLKAEMRIPLSMDEFMYLCYCDKESKPLTPESMVSMRKNLRKYGHKRD